jgi:UDP-glucose 4-epimerase
MGVPAEIVHLEARQEVLHAHSSHDKVRRVFGLGAPVALDAGLARMAAWVREHGPRQSAAFEAIEISRNLPPSWRTA